MEIVIKIPEEIYNCARDDQLDLIQTTLICGSVGEGIPLPKHHGRLISEEDMLSVILFSKLFDNAKVGEVKGALLNIPTIIEADKEITNEISN